MTTKQKEGYDLAYGAVQYFGRFAIIVITILLIAYVIRGYCGIGMDDSDKDGWHRSGVVVITDYKTGVEYLSDGHGGLVRRQNH